jgi:hypothetical protein
MRFSACFELRNEVRRRVDLLDAQCHPLRCYLMNGWVTKQTNGQDNDEAIGNWNQYVILCCDLGQD